MKWFEIDDKNIQNVYVKGGLNMKIQGAPVIRLS